MNRRSFLVATASLALAPRALAAAGSRPSAVALVTADLESRLVAVELASGRILRQVPTLAFPRSIEAVGNLAVVAHSDRGAVSLVDGASLAVLHVLRDFGEPRYTAGHPDLRHAYITDAKRGDVAVLDLATRRVVAREPVGLLARHVTLDPLARTLWIALGTKAKEIAVVDVSNRVRPRLVRRFRPPFPVHDVGWTPDGAYVWVTAGDRDELAVYNARTGRIVARPSADTAPQHVTFATGRAYVTSGWNGTLRVHRLDGRPLRTTSVPVGSYNVQQSGGSVLTPGLGRGSLSILDRDGRLLRSERIARSSHDACVVAARVAAGSKTP